MPTPTQDYQCSLLGLLMGAGTDYQIGKAGISGLGNPPAKTADVQLDGQDGGYASPDYFDVRTVLVPIEIFLDTAEDNFNALQTLKAAWRPTTADINFHVQLPGLGHIYYVGRPRSLDADISLAPFGRITCIGEFRATDPFAHDV